MVMLKLPMAITVAKKSPQKSMTQGLKYLWTKIFIDEKGDFF